MIVAKLPNGQANVQGVGEEDGSDPVAVLSGMRTTASAMSQHTVLLTTTRTVGQALTEVEAEEVGNCPSPGQRRVHLRLRLRCK